MSTKFSQYDEEQAILANVQKTGTFLDLGAYHPEIFSNTRALYLQGWSGMCVDVSPAAVKALATAYACEPRVTVVQAAVAVEAKWLTIQLTDDAVTTSDKEVYQTWKAAGGYYGSVRVLAIPVACLITGPLDFINIDVEGCSADIFLHLLGHLVGQHPACMCVEHDRRTPELIAAAAAHGYRPVYTNGTNLVVAK